MDADPSQAPTAPSLSSLGAKGCVLLALGGAVLVGFGLSIAIPNYISMASRAKRAELPTMVEAIRTAQLARHTGTGRFIACGNEMGARAELVGDGGKRARDFNSAGDPCWDELGWEPEGQVRGAYWVEVTASGDDFKVTGLLDVDADGEYAIFVATRDREAEMVSPSHAY